MMLWYKLNSKKLGRTTASDKAGEGSGAVEALNIISAVFFVPPPS
jgi:hypothetical protein